MTYWMFLMANSHANWGHNQHTTNVKMAVSDALTVKQSWRVWEVVTGGNASDHGITL